MSELTKTQINDLNQSLLKLKQELQVMLEQVSLSSDTVSLDQQAFGRVSRGDALQQQSMAKASQIQSQERLRQVMKALARIDSGDYGFCISCDNSIGFERLKARSETLLCLSCQSASEG